MTATACILVIEDDRMIRRFLRASIESQGYSVIEASTGTEGLALAGTHAPDVILLDLGLPDIDGLEVLKRLREFYTFPITIISARGQEADKVAALDSGADDYLTKPFGVPELLARLRVALRNRKRPAEGAAVTQLRLGDVEVDLESRRVTRLGEEIRLTPNEWKLLSVLVQHAGKVVTHKQLLKEVWGTTRASQEQYVRVYLHQLRQKLEANPADPVYLITDPWVGYRLVVE